MGESKTICVRDMGRIFVYGSLRKGHYNHNYLNFNLRTKYLRTAKLKNARMYNLGSYPCVVLTNTPSDTVVGELYEFLDSEFEKLIRKMEQTAGYVEKTVRIDREDYIIYVFEEAPKDADIIRSGDWNLENSSGGGTIS